MKLDKAAIANLLATNDKAVGRALVVLMNNQTADEQRTETTRVHNGMGFRPCHAYMGTRMAKFYAERGYLTPKQIAYWHRKMKSGDTKLTIYWKQLSEAAERKAAAKVEVKSVA